MERVQVPWVVRAFLLNFSAAFLAFIWTIIWQRGLFSVAGDFNSQQIPFAMAANDAIKSGQIIWDWSLDLGSNFIGGQAFYILGNPSFWISMLFPSKYFMYVCGWLYMLKYAVAGTGAFLYLRRYVKHEEAALAASMLYAFSGFMGASLLFYHFHDVAALFPFMMVTLDDLVEDGKRGPFLAAVAINAMTCYYFIIGEIMFLAAYYLFRYVLPDFRRALKALPSVLLEGFLGCLITSVLLVPAFLFTVQNPRVDVDYTGSNSGVFSFERYLFMLKGALFPGEVMSNHSAVIKRDFTSCHTYMPMTGFVLVIAFMRSGRQKWLKRLLKFCLVCAVVPIFNAAFSLFAGLYCRWYYMAILMMTLAGAIMLDHVMEDTAGGYAPFRSSEDIRTGALIWAAVAIAFGLFLALVPWSKSEASKIYAPITFGIWLAVSLIGTVLTWFLTRPREDMIRRFIIGVFVFSAVTQGAAIGLYQDANGEDARHLYDRLMTSGKIAYETPEYRFTGHDNVISLAHGYPTVSNFCSTVSGSIFRFYEGLGLERSVKSPDPPEGLFELVSARFTAETKEREDEEAIQVIQGKYVTYYIYENPSVPPIGFTYDTYMTLSEFKETKKDDRAALMLKTLVIPDEEETEVAGVLRHYDASHDGAGDVEHIRANASAHLSESARNVVQGTDRYACTITAKADTYAFFSIPNDSGWKASVNGDETEILDVNGFMAVPVGAGENRIEFTYTVPGLRAGILLSLSAAFMTIAYLILALYGEQKRLREME